MTSAIDRKSDKQAAHVNLSSAQLMFQAGKFTDEELGQQPRCAACRGAPSPTTTANPLLSTEFLATGRSRTPLARSSVRGEKPGHSSTSAGHSASAVLHQPFESRQVSTPLNERELRVAPDEHSIISDDLLRCTPYIVNSLYEVLICTDCRHCINPDRASEHLRKYHPHSKVGTGFVSQLNERFRRLGSEEVNPPTVIGPVFGLAIPLHPITTHS
jgi:Orsellinic acid/F9775 biosynthesis cluster protein D